MSAILNFAPLPHREIALKTGVLIFLNGELVSEDRAVVSVFDRSFLYGDGLFETMRIFNGKPFRWHQHMERLERGAEYLKIKVPFSNGTLRDFVDELVAKNQMSDALLRLTLSRGVGIRGYSPKGADHPTIVMSLHPAPEAKTIPRWKLVTSAHRLPANEPLAQFKTCNKLAQILARAEADASGADEALLLNTDGFVVEGASSNLFWIDRDILGTPPLASGVLSGVTRTVVMEICERLGVECRELQLSGEQLQRTDGVFVSLSSFGVCEAISLDGRPCGRSVLAERIFDAYGKLLLGESV